MRCQDLGSPRLFMRFIANAPRIEGYLGWGVFSSTSAPNHIATNKESKKVFPDILDSLLFYPDKGPGNKCFYYFSLKNVIEGCLKGIHV